MPTGGIVSTARFVINRLRNIRSGNSLFELILFVCSYYDVAVIAYMLDHVKYKLPISALLLWGMFASAFIKIMLLLLYDEGGLSVREKGGKR